MREKNSDEEPQSRLLRWLLYLLLLLLSCPCLFLAAQLGTSRASYYPLEGSMVSDIKADYSTDSGEISFAPLDEEIIAATAEDENGLKREPTGDGSGVAIAAVPPTARPTPVIPPPASPALPPPTQPSPPAASQPSPPPTQPSPPASPPATKPLPPTTAPSPAATPVPPTPATTTTPVPPTSVPPTISPPSPPTSPPPPPPPPPTLPPRPSPPPRVLAVSPISACNDAAVAIVITGANFVANPTAYLVDGGATALATTYISPNVLNAVIPAWFTADYYDLRVTNPDAQSGTLTDAFTLTNPIPLITGVLPDNGPDNADTNVVINGSNFVNGLSARLDGFSLLGVTVVDSSTVNATVPGLSSVMPAGPYTVTIANPGPLTPANSLAYAFTVTIPPGAEYGGAPTCISTTNCISASGAPDGAVADIDQGGYLTLTLPASGIRDGPGYDFVYYELPVYNPPSASPPPPGGVLLDWVVVEVSEDGTTWQQVFNWGDGAPNANSNVASYPENDNEPIPSSALWPSSLPLNTGIAIDISIISPPAGTQYPYIRFSNPYPGDAAQVDAILRLH